MKKEQGTGTDLQGKKIVFSLLHKQSVLDVKSK